jgi:hypothetical protein
MSRGGFTTIKCLSDRKVSFQACFVGNAKSEVPKCNVCPGRVSPVLSWILHTTRSVQNVRESTKDIFDTTVIASFSSSAISTSASKLEADFRHLPLIKGRFKSASN